MKEREVVHRVVITPSIIWWLLCALLGLWFLYAIKDIIILFFTALVLSAAVDPVIRRVTRRWRIPRAFVVGGVYLFFFGVLLAFLSFFIPLVIKQFREFFLSLPFYAEGLGFSQERLRLLSSEILSLGERGFFSEGFFSKTFGVAQGVISFAAVVVISLYLSIYEDGVERFFRALLPRRLRPYFLSRISLIYKRLGSWMLGQLLLMALVGGLYFLVLLLLGVPNALVLAVFGGFLEIVPYLGPLLAILPAALLGLSVSPLTGAMVVGGYFLVQQIENHFLVPQVMRKAVGLHPLVVILSLLIGAKIAGVMGVILAVPVALALQVFISDALDLPSQEQETPPS